MKTRADIKRELDASVRPGDEGAFLESAGAKVEELRERLVRMRNERAQVMRQISVRERKCQDWKGKVPRARMDPTMEDALEEMGRAGSVPCHWVGSICMKGGQMGGRRGESEGKNADEGADGDGVVYKVVLRKEFRKGLSGVEGFEKLWVIAVVPSSEGVETGKCGSWGVSSEGVDNSRGWNNSNGLGDSKDPELEEPESVYLWLVDVISVEWKTGAVRVKGLEFLEECRGIGEVKVLDVKPYLPYCEALHGGEGVV